MAHEFEIRKKGVDPDNMTYGVDNAYFFGFCEGVMYQAFKHPEANGGMSGYNVEFVISKAAALKGLDKAIKAFNQSDYPDKTRMDDIKTFRKNMLTDKSSQKYIICYS